MDGEYGCGSGVHGSERARHARRREDEDEDGQGPRTKEGSAAQSGAKRCKAALGSTTSNRAELDMRGARGQARSDGAEVVVVELELHTRDAREQVEAQEQLGARAGLAVLKAVRLLGEVLERVAIEHADPLAHVREGGWLIVGLRAQVLAPDKELDELVVVALAHQAGLHEVLPGRLGGDGLVGVLELELGLFWERHLARVLLRAPQVDEELVELGLAQDAARSDEIDHLRARFLEGVVVRDGGVGGGLLWWLWQWRGLVEHQVGGACGDHVRGRIAPTRPPKVIHVCKGKRFS
mmetsp:Transcript_6575/g.16757  ORF Transcript_6575/g.16757 Transcript_6575/m.16757 type:complete len:294 (+) Transcript_6575:40-921(+)